ncbi:MAG: NUDIX hydrolase [Magnetococcales bacterium]|nr:NUDIX hydrolase [Magnetococcales bacterium]
MPSIRERRTVYETPWFRLIARDVEGFVSPEPYYALDLPDYAAMVAVTQEGKMLLVRQYRPAAERVTLELPSGIPDRGEQPVEAAVRELREETGYRPLLVEALGSLHTDTGRLSNRVWCFFALVEPDPHPPARPVDEPPIETLLVPWEEFYQKQFGIKDGFDHAIHVAAVSLAVARGLLPPSQESLS